MATAQARFARVAVVGPGRIGRQIALAFALGGHRVRLVDVKPRDDAGAASSPSQRCVTVPDHRGVSADTGVPAET